MNTFISIVRCPITKSDYKYLGKNLLGMIAILVTLGAILSILGCGDNVSKPIAIGTSSVSDPVNKADGSVLSSKDLNHQTSPHADDTGKELLIAQDKQLDTAHSSLGAAKVAINTTQTKIDKLTSQYNDLTSTYTKLYNSWYCKLYRFVVKMLWIIVGAYLLIGLGSVALYAFGGSFGVSVGTLLIHNLPFMSPFSWLQDVVAAKYGTTPVPTTPVVVNVSTVTQTTSSTATHTGSAIA